MMNKRVSFFSNRFTHLPVYGLFVAGLLAVFGVVYTVQASFQQPSAPAQSPGLHPDFVLLDENGENVLDSGRAVSTMQTCGVCHDTAYIESHSFHADVGLGSFGTTDPSLTGHPWDASSGLFGNWSPITYRLLNPPGDQNIDLTTADWVITFGERHVGGGPATASRSGIPLTDLTPNAADPEASVTDPATGQKTPWNWNDSGVVEMNCFLCHTAQPNNAARIQSLKDGAFGWSNTATLAKTGIASKQGDIWVWDQAFFTEAGEITAQAIGIQGPSNDNCGTCHGVVHNNLNEPLNDAGASAWRTSTTGQIISPQKLSETGLNLANKADLYHAWDVHAERVVQCTQCHYSLNNPIYYTASSDTSPAHLLFDPRRLDFGAYLERPLHQFARGESAQNAIAPNLTDTMRRCDSCHETAQTHSWLPYTDKHMESISCETCHIPTLYAPAYQQVDWTVLLPDLSPKTEYRGVENPEAAFPLMTGYQPVLLQRADVSGGAALSPYNLVSAWYWVHGEGENVRPVLLDDLEKAWFVDGNYAPEIMAAFDQNQNGALEADELVVDSDEKVMLIANRLADTGLQNPRITAETQAFSINHNVVNGKWATRDCRACHGSESRVTSPLKLASYTPGGIVPETVTGNNLSASGDFIVQPDGSLHFIPNTRDQGLYILGHNSVSWIDWLGILSFLGVLAGVFTHGGLRYLAAKRMSEEEEHLSPAIKEVYMYTVYERFWHWLQTATILLLLFTGLIIHKPDMFGLFSFHYVVLVHNVLAAILVINAALSLFYHLVSGEIKQYIPRPYGFFDQAIAQAKYYIEGIFKSEAHPFEKTPDKKLNPLQQVTYFGILNILLPLQIITGALMWGAQRWPDIAAALGGLPFLGPAHSLIAWLFASFIVAHVYLTTTGPYPMAGIKAMMLGWDEIETHTDEYAVETTAIPEPGND